MEAPCYFNRFVTATATRANLPHWSARCACFVTFRLADSLPQERLACLSAARETWLAAHPEPWSEADTEEYRSLFDDRVQQWLDAGYGSCPFRAPEPRQIVEATLHHFADVRYSLYAYVVMPNHVHVLFMPAEGYDVSDIVQAWKGFSAKAINRLLNRTGTLWQKESWDRLVRDVEEFDAYRAYIRGNDPVRAFDAYAAPGEATSSSLQNKEV